jgi:hypothetical protein
LSRRDLAEEILRLIEKRSMDGAVVVPAGGSKLFQFLSLLAIQSGRYFNQDANP